MNKLQTQNSTISFGMIADLQYCDAPQFKDRFFRNAPDKLRKAILKFNKSTLDFVVNLGDSIDQEWRSFDGILPIFETVHGSVYHVLGNHDYEVADQYKPQVHVRMGIEKYYDFPIGNWRFIVLDGNEISTFANAKGTKNYQRAEEVLLEMEQQQKINAQFWNGGIGERQIAWLVRILGKASKNHENVILFCHYPIFPADKHNLHNDNEMLTLLSKYNCVKAWFNGHNHDGNYGQWNNIHFVNMKGMVETADELAFSIITLTDHCISIHGFGVEISANLFFK